MVRGLVELVGWKTPKEGIMQLEAPLAGNGVLTAVSAIAPGFVPGAKVVPASGTAASANVIMLAPKAQVSIMVEYTLAKLVATLHGNNGARQQQIITEIRDRIYREDKAARIFRITWEPTRHPVSGNMSAEANVTVLEDGKNLTVRVCPAFETGIDFLRIKNDGDRFVSHGSFHCILLRPEANRRDQEKWTAVEIGLARLSDLEEFNKLSEADPIPLLPHTLMKLGQRRMVWTPTTIVRRSFGKTRQGQAKEKELLGYIGSKMVFLDPSSVFPDFKKGKIGEDGKPKNEGFKPSVFSIDEGPASVTVKYLGKPGNVEINDGNVAKFSSTPDFDPWAVLGRSPSRLDYNGLQRLQARIMGSLMDPENSAAAYARALGILRDGADLQQIQTVIGPMVTDAVEKAREELKLAWNSLSASVDTLAAIMKLDEILDGQDLKTVEARRGGNEDKAAQSVASAIGSPFDWACPMHRELRVRLIVALKAKEPKPVAVTPEPTPVVTEEATGAETPAEPPAPTSDKPPGTVF